MSVNVQKNGSLVRAAGRNENETDYYSVLDTASESINNQDYVPILGSEGTKKRALWSTIVQKIIDSFPLKFRVSDGSAQYSIDGGTNWRNFRNPVGTADASKVLTGYTFANSERDEIEGSLGTETKTVKSTTSSQTINPTSGKLISSVTVSPIDATKTLAATNGTKVDMGGAYRYVNTNAVYDAGSDSVTIPTNTISLSGTTITAKATASNSATKTTTDKTTITKKSATTYYGKVGGNKNPTLFSAGSYVYFEGDFKMGGSTYINNIKCSTSGTAATATRAFNGTTAWMCNKVYVFPYNGSITAVNVKILKPDGSTLKTLCNATGLTGIDVGDSYTAVDVVDFTTDGSSTYTISITCTGGKARCLCIWHR